ncbi:Heavy-metal-associated domain (N-terminus) and membrane-bounded cytochrome biogenesis cycZ-like domain, possible membrane copper tolerance protein [hydrothermal vent metagenome]|uniref:Heavy-metal-associated domain (N-terminus) and membrane-bounded cytochrome biogenesis cycZ-like domain, possible membrane copper tolerance protein n=1 Tax=hydrothermal vent metagenome TaxID=652676 RepID=A0A1W1C6J0_9ZZZZ
MEALISIFIVGFFASIGHCVAMCGGIVGALTVGIDKEKQSEKFKVIQYHLAYNFGRLLSYTLMGVIFGYLGSVLIEMTIADKVLRIISGLLMIAMGLYLAGWWFGLQKIEKIGAIVWKKIQPIANKMLPVNSMNKAFSLGLLWGYLPCGVVYSALAFSMASGSWYQGGLLMLSFGLGTLPALLLMGGLSSIFTKFIQRSWVKKIAGLIVIILGVLALLMPIKSLLKPHQMKTMSHQMMKH